MIFANLYLTSLIHIAMKKRAKKYLVFAAIIFIVLLWIVILTFVSPQEIVDRIGLENGYLVAFLVAVIGGVTTITGSSYYIVIATLASGGLNPWILGITAGIGVGISDSVFFFIGRKFRDTISEEKKEKANEISEKLEGKPKWFVPVLIFVYTGLTPLPTDILTLSLGLLNYKYKQIVIPIFLGGITATTIFAYFGASILEMFF